MGISRQISQSNPKRALSKPILMLAMFAFAALAGLGFIRFSASHLDHRLRGIDRSIAEYTAEEAKLGRVLSNLQSPIKIYSYCKDRLGMQSARQEAVRLPRLAAAKASDSEPQKGWRASMYSFFGFTVN